MQSTSIALARPPYKGRDRGIAVRRWTAVLQRALLPREPALSRGISMRVIVMAVALGSGADAALAPPGSTTPGPAAPARSAAAPAAAGLAKAAGTSKSAVDESKAECMRLWDTGTHMSKQEW